MTSTCKDCGYTLDELGNHPPALYPLTSKEYDWHATIKCSGCGSNVNLFQVKDDGENTWHIMRTTGQMFCKYCSHILLAKQNA